MTDQTRSGRRRIGAERSAADGVATAADGLPYHPVIIGIFVGLPGVAESPRFTVVRQVALEARTACCCRRRVVVVVGQPSSSSLLVRQRRFVVVRVRRRVVDGVVGWRAKSDHLCCDSTAIHWSAINTLGIRPYCKLF